MLKMRAGLGLITAGRFQSLHYDEMLRILRVMQFAYAMPRKCFLWPGFSTANTKCTRRKWMGDDGMRSRRAPVCKMSQIRAAAPRAPSSPKSRAATFGGYQGA